MLLVVVVQVTGFCSLTYSVQAQTSGLSEPKKSISASSTPQPTVPSKEAALVPTPVPDPPKGKTNLEAYVENLRETIEKAWHPPATTKAFNSIVTFSVGQDGALSDFLVTQSSGNADMDALAIETLKLLSPAPPLPQGSPNRLIVDFTFVFSNKPSNDQEDQDPVAIKRRAWEEHPLDPLLTLEYGRALRFAGHFQEAIDMVRQAVNLGYEGSETAIELSSSYFRLGKPKEAKETLLQCIKSYPKCSQAYKLLADIFFDEKLWSKAEEAYRQFLQLVPKGPLAEFAQVRVEICQRQGAETDEEE